MADSRVPLFSAQAANHGIDFEAPIKRVLQSHWYVLGNEVGEFESEFAAYVGVPHCVSLANGTDALELGLRALGVERGDTVLTVANAGFYSSTAIHAIGAVPVYVDVDPATLTLSVDALRGALARKPKVVVVTHLYGQLADIEAIVELAHGAGVAVLEDCAQSHGARRNGRQAGAFGDVGCFSFYPTKNLGALGDGGAVVTRNEAVAARLRELRQYGWVGKYHVGVPGGRNSRLDEMQAAILRMKLPLLDGWNAQRRAIAQRYNDAFRGLSVQCPVLEGEAFVAHLYVLRLEDRDAFRAFLDERGIATDVHYPVPDTRQAAYPGAQAEALDTTLRAASTVVTLPCFPGMSDAQVDAVIAAVQAFFA